MRWMMLALLTAGCTFGLGEERNLQSRLLHMDAAEAEGITTRLGNALESSQPCPPGDADDVGADIPVDSALREGLILEIARLREIAARTRFRSAMFATDFKRHEVRDWKNIEPGSPEDKAHQAAYAARVYRDAMTAQVKAEIYAKLAADLAAGVARVGLEVAKRLPWWMRWGFYLAVAGAAAYGLLLVVGAYAVAVRRIARRRRVAFEQLDDEIERAIPRAEREALVLPVEAHAEHAAVNAKRKKEGVR